MNYSAVVRQLEAQMRLAGVKPGLERISKLLDLLGNPQNKIPVIHIAGTNGKGSVALLCSAALKECGYKVGTYLSPHIFKYNERFLFRGKEISDTEFVKLFSKVFPLAQKVSGITEFEILTAMAFLWFSQKNVDVAVLETGLGGRYDATNVGRTILSIITPISYDHQAILGKTLTKIASEKAGIIKPGVPVVSSAQEPEALAVLMRTAEKLESDISVVEHPLKFRLNVLGEQQRYNAALVLEGLRKLQKYGIYLPRRLILNGFAKVKIPGRIEQINKKPIFFDVGHNPQAIDNLLKFLEKNYPLKKKNLIFGLLKRKDLKSILKIIGKRAEVWAVDIPGDKEAYSAEEIYTMAKKLGLTCFRGGDPLVTYRKLSKMVPETVLAVTGSFHLLGRYNIILGKSIRSKK